MSAEDWIGGEEPPEAPREIACKRCGKSGLHWQDEDGEWVLMESRYKVHRCDMRRVALDDFEAVE